MVKIEVYKSAGKRNWQSIKWFVCRCTVHFGTLSVIVRLWKLKTKLHFPMIMILSCFLGVLSMRFMDGCNLILSRIADILVWKKLRRWPFNSQCLKTVPKVSLKLRISKQYPLYGWNCVVERYQNMVRSRSIVGIRYKVVIGQKNCVHDQVTPIASNGNVLVYLLNNYMGFPQLIENGSLHPARVLSTCLLFNHFILNAVDF